jgi:hypothetical protein
MFEAPSPLEFMFLKYLLFHAIDLHYILYIFTAGQMPPFFNFTCSNTECEFLSLLLPDCQMRKHERVYNMEPSSSTRLLDSFPDTVQSADHHVRISSPFQHCLEQKQSDHVPFSKLSRTKTKKMIMYGYRCLHDRTKLYKLRKIEIQTPLN